MSGRHIDLDGVYEVDSEGSTARFHKIRAPTSQEMHLLLHRISESIAIFLERVGFLERDEGEFGLMREAFDDGIMNHLHGSPITYLIAAVLN